MQEIVLLGVEKLVLEAVCDYGVFLICHSQQRHKGQVNSTHKSRAKRACRAQATGRPPSAADSHHGPEAIAQSWAETPPAAGQAYSVEV